MPQARHCRTRCSIHALTNPHCQPYLKFKFRGNAPVKNNHLPRNYTTTSTDIPKIPKKITPPSTSDPSTLTTTRPMHHANGPAHRHKQSINRRRDDYHHKPHRAPIRTRHKLVSYQHHTSNCDIMSSADDRNNNSNATAPCGRRGGRAFRGRTRRRGFHFNLNAKMALTQHLMRRERGLQPPATDVISLAIGNYHDAPLNARKTDKHVYPTAADRNNILKSDHIYLYHSSPRQDLQSPLALTPGGGRRLRESK